MNSESSLRVSSTSRAVQLGLSAVLAVSGTGPGLAAVAGAAAGAFSPVAYAQDKPTVRRTVEGKVRDKNDAVIKGAVVYIKDTRTLAVKSFLSDDEGTFHFGQLSTNADYEVYAEFEGKRSKSKTISSFDSKTNFNFVLKIDMAKG